jgi:hypothetical protein
MACLAQLLAQAYMCIFAKVYFWILVVVEYNKINRQ